MESEIHSQANCTEEVGALCIWSGGHEGPEASPACLETPPATHEWGKKSCGGGQGGEALEDQEWGKGLLMFLYILSGVSILPSFSLLVMSSPEKWCAAGCTDPATQCLYVRNISVFIPGIV